MNADIKKRWVERLRSGKVKQGRGALCHISNNMCCLGVLCAIAVEDGVIPPPELVGGRYFFGDDKQKSGNYLPGTVSEWADLAANPSVCTGVTDSLAGLNDTGYSFEQIADLVEAQL